MQRAQFLNTAPGTAPLMESDIKHNANCRVSVTLEMTRGGMGKSLPAPLLITSNQIKLFKKMAWFIHPGPEPNILLRPSSSVNKYVHNKYAYNYEGGGSSLSCLIEF